jgi:hypothetical protein
MARAFVCLLLGAAAVGCGGSLAGGTGGSGATGTGGIAGTTGSGAGGDGGTTGAGGTSSGGSPYEGVYTWGDVTVEIATNSYAPGNLVVDLVNPVIASDYRELTFPSTTRLSPNDGAYLIARYGCTGPEIYQVDLYSCGNQVMGGAATPGCLGVIFSPRGVTGNFVDTDGTSCSFGNAGSASFHIPPPNLPQPAQAGPTPNIASGSFMLECTRPDGTHQDLRARFVIPVESQILAC